MFYRVSSSTLTAAFVLAFVVLSNFGVSAIPMIGLSSGARWGVLDATVGNHIEPGTFLPASIGLPSSSRLTSEGSTSSNDDSADGDTSSATEPQSSTTPNNNNDDTTTDSSSDSNPDNTSSSSTSTSTSPDSSISPSPPPPPSSATTNAALSTKIPTVAIPLAVTILFGLF